MDKSDIPSADAAPAAGAEDENMELDSPAAPAEQEVAGAAGASAETQSPAPADQLQTITLNALKPKPMPQTQFVGAIGFKPRNDFSPLTPKPVADPEAEYYDKLWGLSGTLTNMDLMTVDPYDQGISSDSVGGGGAGGGGLFTWWDENDDYEQRARSSTEQKLFQIAPCIVRIPDTTPREYNPCPARAAAAFAAAAAAGSTGGSGATFAAGSGAATKPPGPAPGDSMTKKFGDLHLQPRPRSATGATGGRIGIPIPTGAAASSITGFLTTRPHRPPINIKQIKINLQKELVGPTTTSPGSTTFKLSKGPCAILRFPAVQPTTLGSEGEGAAAGVVGLVVPMGPPPPPLAQRAKVIIPSSSPPASASGSGTQLASRRRKAPLVPTTPPEEQPTFRHRSLAMRMRMRTKPKEKAAKKNPLQ